MFIKTGLIKKTALSLFFVLLFSTMCNAMSKDVYNWSIKRQKNGVQPKAEDYFSFCENYNTAYINKKTSDTDKVIYLTFDAGYENGNVEKTLDILDKHDVKAAFFILDNIIIRNTDLIKKMADNGHLICNHTAKHKDISKIDNKDELKNELDRLEKTYNELTGYSMDKYFRPPEGKFTEKNLSDLSELGYKTVFWSFAYADWDNNKQPSADYAKELILKHTHNGMVILLHPTSATNAAILDELLTMWKKQGYRFGNLSEL